MKIELSQMRDSRWQVIATEKPTGDPVKAALSLCKRLGFKEPKATLKSDCGPHQAYEIRYETKTTDFPLMLIVSPHIQ